MNHDSSLKVLYIVVLVGFAERVVEFIQAAGSGGATIINTRGVSALHKEILGISIDKEKEMVLTVTDDETVNKIIAAIKSDVEFKTESRAVCFTLPVTKAIGLS